VDEFDKFQVWRTVSQSSELTPWCQCIGTHHNTV
jgi:hypothetical protein